MDPSTETHGGVPRPMQPLPPAPPPTGAICRACGCTAEDACTMYIFLLDDEGGCHWVEPDLCSGCAFPEYRTRGPLRDHRYD